MLDGGKKELGGGREQVISKFSFNKFSGDFNKGIREVTNKNKKV